MPANQSLNINHATDWIDDQSSYFISVVILQFIVKVTLRICGLLTNGLTLLVFYKCGLKDGISVCFVALTLSDGICITASLLASMFAYLELELHVRPYVSLFYVSYLLPFYGLMFYNISTVITSFLAVQKCCCIALPWNFKSYFSKGRCVASVCCIYSFCFITFIPFTVIVFPFQPSHDVLTNSTRLLFVWSSTYFNEIFPVLKALNYISIPFTAEIVVLISTVILTAKLRESAQFRASSATVHQTTAKETTKKSSALSAAPFSDRNYPEASFSLAFANDNKCVASGTASLVTEAATTQNHVITKSQSEVKSGTRSMSQKELRATRAVNMVAIIFVVTNTPDVIVFLGSLLAPSFSGTGAYYNTYELCLELQDLLHVVNMSVNLFVYLKFNTRFSNALKLMFLRCISDQGGSYRFTSVSGGSSQVTNVSGGSSQVTNVSGGSSPVTNVSGGSSQVTNVSGGSSHFTNFSGGSSQVTNVSGGSSQVTNVSGGSSQFTNFSGGSSPVTNVSGGSSQFTNFSGGSSPVTNVSGGPSPVTNVSGGSSQVTNISGGSSQINSKALNQSTNSRRIQNHRENRPQETMHKAWTRPGGAPCNYV
ncbi:hypothetical protein Btru_016026 [Bulinus truncatus]|nr:hypothetical protein Btru_016026 [Bulinus truncatus]